MFFVTQNCSKLSPPKSGKKKDVNQATRSFVNRISLVGHKAAMGLEFSWLENPVGNPNISPYRPYIVGIYGLYFSPRFPKNHSFN